MDWVAQRAAGGSVRDQLVFHAPEPQQACDRSWLADHCLCDQPGRHGRGVARQGPARSVGGSHLTCARDRTSGLHRRAVDLRCGDLPRGLALSRDGSVGRTSRRAGRVSPTRACRCSRELSSRHVRRPRQHLSREGDLVSCRGEQLLLRVRELCERRFRHYVGGRASRWHAAVLSTLWARGSARGGSGPQHGLRATRFAVPDIPDVGRVRSTSLPEPFTQARSVPPAPLNDPLSLSQGAIFVAARALASGIDQGMEACDKQLDTLLV